MHFIAVIVIALLLSTYPFPAHAEGVSQPTDSPPTSTSTLNNAQSGAAETASPGPLRESRQKLFDSLNQAKKLGIGIKSYYDELMKIENAVKSETSIEHVQSMIDRLSQSLQVQIEKVRSLDTLELNATVAREKVAGRSGWIITYKTQIGCNLPSPSTCLYISQEGFRCEVQGLGLSGVCYAKAPDWTLIVCDKRSKTYSATPIRIWNQCHREKNRYYRTGDFLKGQTTKICELEAIQYYYGDIRSLQFVVPSKKSQDFLPTQARELASYLTAVPTEIWESGGDGPVLKGPGVVATSCKQTTIPTSTFDIPRGYRQVRVCWEWCNFGGQCNQSRLGKKCPQAVKRGNRTSRKHYPACHCNW